MRLWHCTTCGSHRVYRDAWVALNPNYYDDLTFDDFYCEACEGPCSVEEHNVELEEENDN